VSALCHAEDSSVAPEGVEFTVEDIHRMSFEYKPKEGAVDDTVDRAGLLGFFTCSIFSFLLLRCVCTKIES